MNYKHSLFFKLISIVLIVLHLFIFCLKDVTVVFAEDITAATPANSDVPSVENADAADAAIDNAEPVQDQEDINGAQNVDNGGEEPRRDPAMDNGAQGAGSASSFNITALQNVQPGLFTGALTYSLPISVPSGRKGIQPNITLVYSSQSGNGMLGMGWLLDLGSIERSTKNGVPNYDNADTFIFKSGGSTQELVNIGGNEYRAKTEEAFMKFTKSGDSWQVKDKSGITYYFGQAEASRQVVGGHIFKWCLDRVQDTLGNYMTLTYIKEANQIYPDTVNYTGYDGGAGPAFQVDFDYSDGNRSDYFFSYRSNFLIQTNKLLQTITVKQNGSRIRKYSLSYEYSPSTIRALLTSITQYGLTDETSLPAIEFTYQEKPFSFSEISSWNNIHNFNDNSWTGVRYGSGAGTYVDILDINRDGLPDRVFRGYNNDQYNRLWVQLNNGSSFENLEAWSNIAAQAGQNERASVRYGVTYGSMNTTDINGDALPDRIYHYYNNNYNQWEVQINNGEDFENSTAWTNIDGFHYQSEYTKLWGFCYDPAVWGYIDLFDINGDAKPDRIVRWYQWQNYWNVQLNTGNNSFSNTIQWPNIQYESHVSESYIRTGGGSNNLYFATFDINGDGLPDHLMNNSADNTWGVQYNNGKGFENLQDWGTIQNTNGPWSYMGLYGPGRVITADINGDGLADRVMRNYDNQFNPWQVQINNGHGFEQIVEWPIIHNNNSDRAQISANSGQTTIVDFFDINGDGLADRVMRGLNNYDHWDVQFNNGPMPDLLASISNGVGGTAAITYDTYIGHDNSEAQDKGKLGFPVNIVTEIETSDGRGSSYASQYNYDKGEFDYEGREFRGFGKVTTTDVEGNYSLSYFHQDEYKKGKLYRQEAYDVQGNLYTKSENTWSTQENVYNGYPAIQFVYLSESNSYVYDGDNSARRIKTSYTYGENPQYGNPTQITEYGEVNVDSGNDIGQDRRTTTTEYTYNVNDWIVSLPSQIQAKDINDNIVSQKRFYYDGNDSIEDEPTQGLLTKEEVWCYNPVTEEASWPSSQYAYDDYGNLISVTDANDHTTTTTYDNTYHIYPLTVTNALNHTVTTEYYGINNVPLNNGQGLKGLFGQVKSTQDPNGVISYNAYDDLGRPEKAIGPNDTVQYPAAISEYDLNVTNPQTDPVKITKKVKVTNSPNSTNYPDYYPVYSFYDGMGRLIEAKSEAEPNPEGGARRQIISGIVQYNSRGLVWKKYLPYYIEVSADFVSPNYNQPYFTLEYDCLGRTTQTTNPDNTQSSVSYDDWQVTATDENSHSKTLYYDAFQRLIQVDEHNDGQTYETTYIYDTLGNLAQVRDSQDNTTTITYNSLGRKIRMSDPDMGIWNYEYDNVGNLIRQIDAAQQELEFTYDSINRLTQKRIQDDQTVTYEYDSGQNGIGRLSQVTYEAGSAEFFYDNLGREIRSVKTVEGSEYQVERTYDPLDRLVTLTYPDEEVVTYTYNPQGIETVYSNYQQQTTNYIYNIDYSPTSQITKIEYGNGTTTEYAYNPQTLRLTQLQTTNNQQQSIQDLEYEFDNIGNITAITDDVNNATQQFEYDPLNRLTYANGTYYVQTEYAYDSIGNILTKGNLTLNYENSRPHAVSSYYNSSTGQTVNFTYDANGNMSNRTNEQTNERTNYSYDFESHLTRVEQIYPENQQMSVTLDFNPGWNFFSLPVVPDNPDISSVFSDLVSVEPPDDYTKLLLHSNGQDGSTDFPDSSSFEHSVTANGDAQIDTEQSKFGGSSALFDGAGDYLTVPDSDDWNFGTGDFTIDFWVRFNSWETGLGHFNFMGQYIDANNHWFIGKGQHIAHQDGLYIQFVVNGEAKASYDLLAWPDCALNTWYHLAFVRSGTTGKIFINGVQQSLRENVAFGNNDLGDLDTSLEIGRGNDGYYVNGWIDDMRVSKGIARWTQDFTPPSAPPAAYDQVSRYNPQTDSFENYVGDPEFNEFDTLEYGKGYCIYVNNQDGASVTITGTTPEAQDVSLLQGWNLIPYPYLSQQSTQAALGNLQLNVDYDSVLSYNPQTGEFEEFPGSLENLQPNKSYYLHCLRDTEWELQPLSRTTEFYYDGDGGRVKKVSEIDQAETTVYIGALFETLTTNGQQLTTKKHIYAGANRVCVVETTNQQQTTNYFHSDHLGSSNIITNEEGNQVSRYEYSPFGEVSYQSGDYTTDIKYTGKIEDDTGLYYYGARYYDPLIGRFISPDSIVQAPQDPQSLNRYAYCRNNPVKYVDPTGHKWSWKTFGAIVAGALLGGIVFGVLSVGFNVGLTMSGVVGGMAGGALSGGLQGGWQGALMGAAMGGVLGGFGGWAAGNLSPFANGMILAAGAGVAVGTGGWEGLGYFAGGMLGGMGGYAAGAGFSKSQQFQNWKAGKGFVSDRTARTNEFWQKNEALRVEAQKRGDFVEKTIYARHLGKNAAGDPSSFGPRHLAAEDPWEMGPVDSGPKKGLITTSDKVDDLSSWSTSITTQKAISSGDALQGISRVSEWGWAEAGKLYNEYWVGQPYMATNQNSNYAIDSRVYGAGGDLPENLGWHPEFR